MEGGENGLICHLYLLNSYCKWEVFTPIRKIDLNLPQNLNNSHWIINSRILWKKSKKSYKKSVHCINILVSKNLKYVRKKKIMVHLCDSVWWFFFRHASDNVRQRDLARRRTQLRGQRLQQEQPYERRLTSLPEPSHGNPLHQSHIPHLRQSLDTRSKGLINFPPVSF